MQAYSCREVCLLNTNRIRLVSADTLHDDAPEAALLSAFSAAIHPSADDADAETSRWARQFGLCDSEAAYEQMARGRIGRLAARAFPHANRDGLQLAADWNTLFFVLDDRIEQANLTVGRLASYVSQLSAAFRSGRVAHDSATLALVDLRQRFVALDDEAGARAFADVLDRMFSAFMWEHINRSNDLHPSLPAYTKMRTLTIGLYPQLVLARVTDGIRLSDALLGHPTIVTLMTLTAKIIGLANDLFTFEREHAYGEVHNQVVLLMHECGMSSQEARCAAVEQHNGYMRAFIAAERPLPDAGDEKFELMRFVGVLRSCIRGHLDWAYETGRYDLASRARYSL